MAPRGQLKSLTYAGTEKRAVDGTRVWPAGAGQPKSGASRARGSFIVGIWPQLAGQNGAKRRAKSEFRLIDMPHPWSLDAFVAWVSAKRGRPIKLVPIHSTAASGLCGLWISRRTDDVVVFEADTSPWHQQQIIVHELAHMLFNHDQGSCGMSDGWRILQDLVPSIDPASVRAVLARTVFTSGQEYEAEMLADLILAAAAANAGQRQPTTNLQKTIRGL